VDDSIDELAKAVSSVDTQAMAQDTAASMVSLVLDQALAEEGGIRADGGSADADTDEDAKPLRTGGRCGGDGMEAGHPAAEKLAREFGVSGDEIWDWFCKGFGFGEVTLAYHISEQTGVPVAEIFERRARGQGWGSILQSYDLIAHHNYDENNDKPQPSNKGTGSGNGKDKNKDKDQKH